MGFMDQVHRDKTDQLFFGSERGFGADGEANAGGHPEHMGVYGHIGLLIHHRGNDIGGFPAHPRQFDEIIHRERHFSFKILYQHLGHADKVFRLVVWVGNTPDEGENLIKTSPGQRFRIWETGKKGRRRLVHAFIRALGGEDDRHQ